MQNQIKDFLVKGYGFDLAIAILAGFGMCSLFRNILHPMLGLLTGGIDFSEKYIPLSSHIPQGTPISQAVEMGPILPYGNFIHGLGNLVITGFIIYLAFRIFQKLVARRECNKKEREPAET